MNITVLMENFLTILSGFLTPVIAGTMFYIAYRQYKTDRDKFRWNLYDKRMEVFQSLRDLLGYIMREADVSNEALNKFAVATDKGFFLFDSKINDYLSEVRNKCFSLQEHRRKLGNRKLGIGAERNRLAEENEEIVLFASASRRGGRKGGSVFALPPAEPVDEISSDIFKYTPLCLIYLKNIKNQKI